MYPQHPSDPVPDADQRYHDGALDHPPYASYPVVVEPPQFNIPHGNYYPGNYQPYPQEPCPSLSAPSAQYSQEYPPQLHIHTDLSTPPAYTPIENPQSASSFASASTASAYPPLTPPSAGVPASVPEGYAYDDEYEGGQYHDASAHQQPWQGDHVHPQTPYVDTEHTATVASSSQWASGYTSEQAQQYDDHPAPSYYQGSTQATSPHGDPCHPSEDGFPAEQYSAQALQGQAPHFGSEGVYLRHGHEEEHAHEESYASHGHDPRQTFSQPQSESRAYMSPAHDDSYEYHSPPAPTSFVPPAVEPGPNYEYEQQQIQYPQAGPSTWRSHSPPEVAPTYSPHAIEHHSAHAEMTQPWSQTSPSAEEQASFNVRDTPAANVPRLHTPPTHSPSRDECFHMTPTHSPSREEHFHTSHSPETRPPIAQPRLLAPIPRISRAPASASQHSPVRDDGPRRDSSPNAPSRPRTSNDEEQLPRPPVVPSQSHLAQRRDRRDAQSQQSQSQSFRPFHPYPTHQRAATDLTPRIHYHDGLAGGCMPPPPVFGLFGSYPLSRGPRELPLPGPTCAPASSSSVMRLVLTPPFKRPAPPPPPAPPAAPTRRPRMACFFCRKRKIACGPGPAAVRTTNGGKDTSCFEDDGPCNQCARRGLECERPTESKRGVRKGKGKSKDGEEDEQKHRPHASGSNVTLELAPRPRPASSSSGSGSGSADGNGDYDDDDDDDDEEYEDPGDPHPPPDRHG